MKLPQTKQTEVTIWRDERIHKPKPFNEVQEFPEEITKHKECKFDDVKPTSDIAYVKSYNFKDDPNNYRLCGANPTIYEARKMMSDYGRYNMGLYKITGLNKNIDDIELMNFQTKKLRIPPNTNIQQMSEKLETYLLKKPLKKG